MTDEREAYVQRLLSEAPPLTAEQAALIRRTFGQAGQADVVDHGGAA